jgi:type IV pilus assembly protein PilV
MLALLVFSTAMTGLLSVQVLAMRSSSEAVQRSTAVLLAQDILSRVRANPGQVTAYVGTGFGDTRQRRDAPGTDCDRRPCSPAELAAHDLWHWESLLVGEAVGSAGRSTGGLHQPRACISFAAGRVTFGLYWRGAGAAEAMEPPVCDLPDSDLYDDPALPPGNHRWRRALVVTAAIERTPT